MRGSAIALPIILGCLGPVSPARADWPPQGIEVSNSSTFINETAILRDGSGRLFIKSKDASDNVRDVDSILPDGTVAWGSYVPNTQALAPDELGGIYSAYSGFMVGPTPGIHLQRIGSGGQSFPGPDPSGTWSVSTATLDLQPSLAPDFAGGVYVSWVRGNTSPPQSRLRRMQPNGTSAPGWPDTGLSLPGGSRAQIIPDGSGGVYVITLSSTGTRIYRVTSAGTFAPGWNGSGVLVGAVPAAGGTQADLILSPPPPIQGADRAAGDFPVSGVIAAWSETPSGQPRRIVLQRVLEDGAVDPAWPASGLIAATTAAPVQVIPDGISGATLGWVDGGAYLLAINWAGGVVPGFPPGGVNPLDADASLAYSDAFSIATGPLWGGTLVTWGDNRASTSTIRLRWIRGDGTPEPHEPDPARIVASDVYQYNGVPAEVSNGDHIAWIAFQSTSQYGGKGLFVTRSEIPVTGVPPGGPIDVTFRAWPNPARSDLLVRFVLPDESPARLEIFDVVGRCLRALEVSGAREHVVEFDHLDELPRGLYFLRLDGRMESQVVRFALER